MLFEIKGICQNCAETVNVLVHNSLPISRCPSCNEDPFEVEKIAGVVYIVKNRKIRTCAGVQFDNLIDRQVGEVLTPGNSLRS